MFLGCAGTVRVFYMLPPLPQGGCERFNGPKSFSGPIVISKIFLLCLVFGFFFLLLLFLLLLVRVLFKLKLGGVGRFRGPFRKASCKSILR